jgi:hypothetical protein
MPDRSCPTAICAIAATQRGITGMTELGALGLY